MASLVSFGKLTCVDCGHEIDPSLEFTASLRCKDCRDHLSVLVAGTDAPALSPPASVPEANDTDTAGRGPQKPRSNESTDPTTTGSSSLDKPNTSLNNRAPAAFSSSSLPCVFTLEQWAELFWGDAA